MVTETRENRWCIAVALCAFGFLYAGCSASSESSQQVDREQDALSTSDAERGGTVGSKFDTVVNDSSWYTMTITLPDGEEIVVDRDLKDSPSAFSYGSAHIQQAVAFSVTDTITWPRTMTVTLDFGKVVGDPPDFPLQTGGPGSYPFSLDPPAVEVYVQGLQYKSVFDDADGSVEISVWGSGVGDVMAGTYTGRIIQDTSADEKLWLDVTGAFHFIIPESSTGQ